MSSEVKFDLDEIKKKILSSSRNKVFSELMHSCCGAFIFPDLEVINLIVKFDSWKDESLDINHLINDLYFLKDALPESYGNLEDILIDLCPYFDGSYISVYTIFLTTKMPRLRKKILEHCKLAPDAILELESEEETVVDFELLETLWDIARDEFVKDSNDTEILLSILNNTYDLSKADLNAYNFLTDLISTKKDVGSFHEIHFLGIICDARRKIKENMKKCEKC